MDFLSGFLLGAVVAILVVAGFAQHYMCQRNEARDETDYWQKRSCRHEAMVNALATIPKEAVKCYAHTWSNN